MDLFIGSKLSNDQFLLSEDEFHHCTRVTRHKIGDSILITNFDGNIYSGILDEIQNNEAKVITKSIYKSEVYTEAHITIAISPTQAIDRFEWFIEKAVECGVHNIIPLICKRTEHTRLKSDRLLRIIKNAAKQTLRPILPTLQDQQNFIHCIEQSKNVNQKFIAHCEDDVKTFLGQVYKSRDQVLVLIGPAGDFTLEEIKLARDQSFIPVSLGDYRLRTETAGLSALQIIQTIRHL